MARKKPKPSDITEEAAALAEFAANIQLAAEVFGVRGTVVENFLLDVSERAVAAGMPGLSSALKQKLLRDDEPYTLTDTTEIVGAMADTLKASDPLLQVRLLSIIKKLMEFLHTSEALLIPEKPMTRQTKPTNNIYQFKITLIGSKPPIWRRIQVQDCTLDELHGHIQNAMGWENCHLHQFDIKGKYYGDPELLQDYTCGDSTMTNLSQILPSTGKRFKFKYEYDFGDCWKHEILFERTLPANPEAIYPLCVAGARACPPEDCGGLSGYSYLIEAILDPEHEEHEIMLDWVGGQFDPEEFDTKRRTREM